MHDYVCSSQGTVYPINWSCMGVQMLEYRSQIIKHIHLLLQVAS